MPSLDPDTNRSWMKAGSFPVLAPGGGHFPPQMLPVLEPQVTIMMMLMMLVMTLLMMFMVMMPVLEPQVTFMMMTMMLVMFMPPVLKHQSYVTKLALSCWYN